jgi:hypothetical protein
MSDRLIDEVRRERPDLANDPDALRAEAEYRLREVEEAIGRLNKVVDVMRSRDQGLRAKWASIRASTAR